VARRLLREDAADGTLDFAHDKLREVAYLEIGAGRRQLLHRAVAEVLAANGEEDARLAEHFERGHVWPAALHHMVQAARQSQRLFAMRDALHWFDRAIALAQARPDTLGSIDPIALHDERGAARAQAGLTAGAVHDIGRVITAARGRGDRAGLRDALIRLGMAHRRADDYEAAVAALNEALRESRAMGDERHAADTLYHLGTVAWSDGRNGEATACHAEAVAICERLGLADLVAVQAWHGRGEAYFNHAEPADAMACYRRSMALAHRIGDRSYEAENRMMLGFACTGDMGLGDYAQAEGHFDAALEMARQADLQWHLGPTLIGLHHVRACTGRYGTAWTGLSETLHWLQGVRQTRYQLMAHHFMGRLLIELGLHARAAALLERALALARESKVRFWLPLIASDLAIASLRLGGAAAGPLLESAQQEARRQLERTHLARCLEGLAEFALARGDIAAALVHAQELLELAQGGGLAELAAVARRWRGQALAARGERDAAIAELRQTLEAAQRLGRVRLAFDAACGLATLGEATHDLAHELAQRMHASVEGTELIAELPVPLPRAG
jgi:tetratricopeptide (TPR) repeat protein